MTKYEAAANLALFLKEKTGTIYGVWKGHMKAAEQRALFGRFLGKGRVVINGDAETITHTVKRCFGLDFETTFNSTWGAL